MNVFIYTLEDPITGEIRYIGKTKNPKMRFQNHMNRKHNEKSHKTSWVESLKKLHLKPKMEILDIVNENEWQYWEKFWIQQFIVWGFNLVNHTSGGDGLTFGNQTSFKKGNESWNTGLGNTFICENCGANFKSPISSKRKYCSILCASNRKPNSGTFKKDGEPWNKGKNNYKLNGLKKSKPVLQYTLNDILIKEHLGCKEAALEVNCHQESIRYVCNGKIKTAKGFKWKYKNY